MLFEIERVLNFYINFILILFYFFIFYIHFNQAYEMPRKRLLRLSTFTVIEYICNEDFKRNDRGWAVFGSRTRFLYQRILHFCVTTVTGLIFMVIFVHQGITLENAGKEKKTSLVVAGNCEDVPFPND